MKLAVLERVLVQADHLVLSSWEGPQLGLDSARAAMASLQPPISWRPSPPQEEDFERGLGKKKAAPISLGHYSIKLSTHLQANALNVELEFQPSPALGNLQVMDWWIPGEEPRKSTGENGLHRIRYSLNLGKDAEQAAKVGVVLSGHSIGLLDSTWLAVPLLEDVDPQQILPPSWNLTLEVPAFDHALSWTTPTSNKVLDSSPVRELTFPTLAPGNAWPFAIIGQYRKYKDGAHPIWLRSGSRSREYQAPLTFLDNLDRGLLDWLPGNEDPWRLATFPGAGDRMLPGLAILDEKKDWLQTPLDAAYGNGTRRKGLAELITSRKFGLQLRGLGTAAPFLEVSLAEYSAWRLLRLLEHSKESANMLLSWKQREASLPAVRIPLSLTPRDDLLGPQRLLSRGALVWRMLANEVGEDCLDACLNAALRDGGQWSTEDLRLSLEKRSELDLLPFFRKYIYGIHPLPKE
jgi:hypothetical protein